MRSEKGITLIKFSSSFILSLRVKKSSTASGLRLGSRRIAAGWSIGIISTPFFSETVRFFKLLSTQK